MRFCNHCGYEVSEAERKLIKNKSTDSAIQPKTIENNEDQMEDDEDEVEDEEIKSAEVIAEPESTRLRVPPGATVKSKIPKSKNCQVCNTKTEDICFFCDYGICKQHRINMQVFADNAKFGNVIQSCLECGQKKNGKQPSKDEAAEIGFFFNIKPYHEWKILD